MLSGTVRLPGASTGITVRAYPSQSLFFETDDWLLGAMG